MNKLIRLIPLILVLALLLAPFAYATVSIVDEQALGTSVQSFLAAHPSSGAASAHASTFVSDSSLYLLNVTAEFCEIGDTALFDEYVMAEVRGVSSGKPNSTIYAVSTNVLSEDDVPEYPTRANFTFIFLSGYQLKPEEYTVVFVCTYAFNVTTVQHIRISAQTVGGADYDCALFSSSAWSAMSYDLRFTVYGSDDYVEATGGGEPTPTPTATPIPDSGGNGYVDYLIDQFIDFFIPLIVMLIPAFLLGYVCRMGKWGYIIGLAIGSGLGYVFISGFPVWLIFLVSLGIIGFAYSEVKRGN